ncbi:MAG: LysR family transcriptional regulator [Lachnospirales bacterium]
MNIAQLEYFVTLAETLSFTKASEKLHITQPNLSKAIVNIEQNLGCKLFIRTKRDVQLTNAGKVFYNEAIKIIQKYKEAIKMTQDMGTGITGNVKIGFLGTAVIRTLPEIINKFNDLYPNIKVDLFDFSYSPLINALHEKEVDIAILPDSELPNIPNLLRKHFFYDDMCVAVHKSHPLAKFDSISILEIEDEPFVQINPKKSYHDYNLINNICLENGFSPKVEYKANTLFNMLMMVECKVGITLLASHMQHFATENVKFVKIDEYKDFFKVICAYRQTDNTSIDKFINVLEKYT